MNENYEEQRYQLATSKFKFDIIYSSRIFQKYIQESIKKDLVRDICDESMSHHPSPTEIPESKYLNIVQKSPTWLYLRSLATGTASSVGKYIPNPDGIFPDLSQLVQAWYDKLTNAPFTKVHTMIGHMKWGVGYEDPALIHFAKHLNLCVSQVGTSLLPMKYIAKLGLKLYSNKEDKKNKDLLKILKYLKRHDPKNKAHFLVSPDGVVGIPKPKEKSTNKMSRKLSTKLVGMLEIKCISPFHHEILSPDPTDPEPKHDSNDPSNTESAGYLGWVEKIENRQWDKVEQIPYVYIVQQAIQAMAGARVLKMTPNHKMWFIRWQPRGFSLFTFHFHHMFKVGVWACSLYYLMKTRISSLYTDGKTSLEELPSILKENILKHTKLELKLIQNLHTELKELYKSATYEYKTLYEYPEFDVYREVTKQFRFKVLDSDEVEFGLGHGLDDNRDSDEECLC